jgi:hypothetical protein
MAFSAAKHDSNLDSKLGTAELLFESASRLGLRPTWISPDGLFVISRNEEEHYVNFAHSPLNSHVSASLAKDKYLTRLILERNNLPKAATGLSVRAAV